MSEDSQRSLQPVVDFLLVLNRLSRAVLGRWHIVALSALIGIGAGVFIGQFSKPQYTSSMLVTAAPTQSGNLPGGLSSALASARPSIAGLGFAGIGGSSQFKTYIQLAQSTVVAEAIMDKPDDMVWLLGSDYDPKTKEWRRVGWLKGMLYGLFNLTPSRKPSPQDVQRALDRTITISVSADNQDIATIGCTNMDPLACPKILLDVHQTTEARLSSITLSDALRLSQYINRLLPTVQQQVVRDALTDMLAGATKQVAISELHQAVGAVVISPPYPSMDPSFPQPTLLIAESFAIGTFLGCVLALILPRFRPRIHLARGVRSLRARIIALRA